MAARAAWGLLPGPRPGLRLRLEKGTPLSSGMGSSAASAVAGAFAVHALFPGRVAVEDLLGPCLEAEAAVAGRHADNLAPALLGGMILVESCDPLRVHRIEPALDLHFVVAKPAVGVDTKAARAAIPDALPRADAVAQLGAVAGLVHALHAGDLELAVRSIRDRVAEPYRKHLVPAFDAVHAAALGAGARACSISGAGPALFALLDDPGKAPGVGAAMVAAWKDAGVEARAWSSPLAKEGARVL